MNIKLQWQTIRERDQCWKGDSVFIRDSKSNLIIQNAYTAFITIEPHLKAIVYEKPNYKGSYQLIFADQELSCIKKIGSISITEKQDCDYQLATLSILNNNRNKSYYTFLPRGVYDQLSVCGYIQIQLQNDYDFKIEKYNNLVQIIHKNEDPEVIIQFKSGNILNCYKNLTYTNITMDSESDIILDPKTTLVINQQNDHDQQEIRIMQSVKQFKPLGTLVQLKACSQLPIERLSVYSLGLSIASLYQLIFILVLFSIIISIVAFKLKQSLQSGQQLSPERSQSP